MKMLPPWFTSITDLAGSDSVDTHPPSDQNGNVGSAEQEHICVSWQPPRPKTTVLDTDIPHRASASLHAATQGKWKAATFTGDYMIGILSINT